MGWATPQGSSQGLQQEPSTPVPSPAGVARPASLATKALGLQAAQMQRGGGHEGSRTLATPGLALELQWAPPFLLGDQGFPQARIPHTDPSARVSGGRTGPLLSGTWALRSPGLLTGAHVCSRACGPGSAMPQAEVSWPQGPQSPSCHPQSQGPVAEAAPPVLWRGARLLAGVWPMTRGRCHRARRSWTQLPGSGLLWVPNLPL